MTKYDRCYHRNPALRPRFYYRKGGPGGSMSQVVGSNSSYKHITNTTWVRAQPCKLQKGCTRLAIASDNVYQLLAHGRWFSAGTPASSIIKNWSPWYSWNTAESGVKTQLINQSINLPERGICYAPCMTPLIYNDDKVMESGKFKLPSFNII